MPDSLLLVGSAQDLDRLSGPLAAGLPWEVLSTTTTESLTSLMENRKVTGVVSCLPLEETLPLLLRCAGREPMIPAVVLHEEASEDDIALMEWYGCAGHERKSSPIERITSLINEAFCAETATPQGVADAARIDQQHKEKEKMMNLESLLEELQGVRGYLGSGLFTYTGDLLGSQSTQASLDLAMTGAKFNDVFRQAHAIAGDLGLEACSEMVITAPLGVVLMKCSGVDAPAHIHAMVVLKVDGNRALAEMGLRKILPKAVAELS
jgi:predicted regulator of Ras-like GTPase activity (Roadblock/LC7/MglB family)